MRYKETCLIKVKLQVFQKMAAALAACLPIHLLYLSDNKSCSSGSFRSGGYRSRDEIVPECRRFIRRPRRLNTLLGTTLLANTSRLLSDVVDDDYKVPRLPPENKSELAAELPTLTSTFTAFSFPYRAGTFRRSLNYLWCDEPYGPMWHAATRAMAIMLTQITFQGSGRRMYACALARLSWSFRRKAYRRKSVTPDFGVSSSI